MTEEQKMLYIKTSKKKALKRYANGLEVVLLFDDDTESCEPDLESVQKHEGGFGYARNLGVSMQRVVSRYFVLKEALVCAKGFLETVSKNVEKENPKRFAFLRNIEDEIENALSGEWK